jgi:hypothetical protein
MQISRFLAAFGVVAIGLLPMSGRAADTEAQIKAREALRSRLDQIDIQPAPTNTVATRRKVAKPAPTKPAAEPQPAPVPAPAVPEPQPQPVPVPAPATAATTTQSVPEPPPAQTPPAAAQRVQTPLPPESAPTRTFAAPAPPANVQNSQPMSEPAKPRVRGSRKTPPPVIAAPAADPDKVAQAREQMRQRLNAAVGQENPEAVSPPQPPVTAPVEQPNPVPPSQRKPVPTVPSTQPANPVVTAPNSENLSAQAPPSAKPKPTKPRKQPEVANKPAATHPQAIQPATPRDYQPLQAPPAPITASQKQRLDELLGRYRADQITPEQYHQERVKILAQP